MYRVFKGILRKNYFTSPGEFREKKPLVPEKNLEGNFLLPK
jgi:hypothetical protein